MTLSHTILYFLPNLGMRTDLLRTRSSISRPGSVEITGTGSFCLKAWCLWCNAATDIKFIFVRCEFHPGYLRKLNLSARQRLTIFQSPGSPVGISESGLAKSASLVSVRQLGGCEICSQGPGISDMLSESYTSHVVTATHQESMLIWRREINRVVDLLMKQIKHWNYLKLISLGLLGCRSSYLAI